VSEASPPAGAALDGWGAPEASSRRIAPALASISPAPTAAEAAAIVVALDALWPYPVVVVPPAREQRGAWRFSGRWWSRPVPARRARPW
jgi:hypothetical protein